MESLGSGKHARTISTFKQTWVAGQMIEKRIEVVQHMLHEGELLDLDAAPLIAKLEEEMRKLEVDPAGLVPYVDAARQSADAALQAVRRPSLSLSAPAPTELATDATTTASSAASMGEAPFGRGGMQHVHEGSRRPSFLSTKALDVPDSSSNNNSSVANLSANELPSVEFQPLRLGGVPESQAANGAKEMEC